MPIVNTKSTAITNRDAVPPVINDGRLERSTLESVIGSVTINTTDTAGASYAAGSTYVLASVPSSAFIRDVLLSNTAMTAGVISLGVARNSRDSAPNAFPVAIGATATALFASGLSVASAASKSNVTNQSGNLTIARQEQPLWQAAGLSADPNTTLDIVALLTTAPSAGGQLQVEVRYADNSN